MTKGLPTNKNIHLGKIPLYRINTPNQGFLVGQNAQRKSDNIRLNVFDMMQKIFNRGICSKKMPIPAIEFQNVGDHFPADLMELIGAARNNSLLADALGGKNSGINEIQQAFGNGCGQMLFGDGNFILLPKLAHLVQTPLKQVVIQILDLNAGSQQSLDGCVAFGALTSEQRLQVALVQVFIHHWCLSPVDRCGANVQLQPVVLAAESH